MDKSFTHDIEECLEVLGKGGIILYPTDTVWGIGCDATNAEAVEKIFKLKRRSDSKAMIVLMAEERDVMRYVANIDLSVFEYLEVTEKPTTVIYNGAIGLADNLVGIDGSIAIRICREKFCSNLLKRFRKPIVSTSANISGEETPLNFMEINEQVKKKVHYIVKYRQDDLTLATPSSVIKWENGKIITLRP